MRAPPRPIGCRRWWWRCAAERRDGKEIQRKERAMRVSVFSALGVLYTSLNSPQQLTKWTSNGGDPCGELWRGITCSCSKVTKMDISFNSMTSDLRESFSALSSMANIFNLFLPVSSQPSFSSFLYVVFTYNLFPLNKDWFLEMLAWWFVHFTINLRYGFRRVYCSCNLCKSTEAVASGGCLIVSNVAVLQIRMVKQ
ncbi:hypothetical protein POM88_005625 [Heracleum sosnowskyi]|uniref:Leucine-rich repeat-containing N-terminal plant-type domain-containing protein n=1 Tax=Heracleum sosnowskyi TaxID=360622 RepID=A0AAD8N4H5_9APIA|nr:hypothetical protein POM88_005625 [Heracleum sosnowskyi]